MHDESPIVLSETNIYVVGCGGGGVNAVNRMIYGGLSGVTFVAANTDRQSLEASPAEVLLPLGASLKGAGAGADPAIGREAAEESAEYIAEILEPADMVFITAGMGGGTGTGAAPVFAEVAASMGKLTLAVVTSPFTFEGPKRMMNAEEGIKVLREVLDTVLVIPNQVLVTRCNPEMQFTRAFELADDTLFKGVAGVAELITTPGEVNLDFNDIQRLLSKEGLVYWGIGYGEGETACLSAVDGALASPFLEDRHIEGAHTLIVNVCGGENLGFLEAAEVLEYVESLAHPDAEIKLGTSYNGDQGDTVKITLIAKGASKVVHRRADTEVKSIFDILADEKRSLTDLPPDILNDPMTPAILRRLVR